MDRIDACRQSKSKKLKKNVKNLNREGAKDAKGFFGLLLQVIHHPFYTVFQRFP